MGKTTTTVALGGIASEQRQRVLLVDLDPHGSLTSYFGINVDHVENNGFSLFENRKHLARDLIQSTIHESGYPQISLIPATTALATLERQGIGDGMGLVLKKVFSLIESDFDKVLIDCPPQLGVLMVNALAACQQLVIPVQTEFLALKGLDRILNTLNMLFKSTQRQTPYTIVPTMFDRRTQASVTSLRTLRNDYGDPVWQNKIPIDTRLRDASKAGVPPHSFDSESRGVLAYKSLYNYLVQATNAFESNVAGG